MSLNKIKQKKDHRINSDKAINIIFKYFDGTEIAKCIYLQKLDIYKLIYFNGHSFEINNIHKIKTIDTHITIIRAEEVHL